MRKMELLNKKQACEFLHIGFNKLWELTSTGQIESFMMGNKRLYEKSKLIEYVERVKNASKM